MSEEEVFMIATAFGDVAELGQGYINRADGERILVPLPRAMEMGEGVRFIVHLGDGTPAFAGAGRCVQVSDQGENAPENERYETLLDSLAFDERSQPVYDYIVAVRQAVYAAGGPGAEEAASPEAVEAEAAEAEAVAQAEAAPEDTYSVEAEPASEESVEVEASEPADAEAETYAEPAAAAPADDDLAAYVSRAESIQPPAARSEAPVAMYDEPMVARSEAPAAIAIAQHEIAPEIEPEVVHDTDPAAFVIPAIPSGMLQRPTVAAHWQPEAPRFPQPSPRSGMFRYSAGALPVPQLPPRPAMAASARISRAPAPN